MKLDKICESTDKETFNKFYNYMSNNSNEWFDLKLNKDGEIVAGDNAYVNLHTHFGSDFDFIDNGKLIIKFASVSRSITLSKLNNLKTLVNLPPIIGNSLTLEQINNVPSFDLDIKKCYNLTIRRSDFYDLANIRNVENAIDLFKLPKITSFDMLPGTYGDTNILKLEKMTIDSSIKNSNKDLKNLILRDIKGFKNFVNLPHNIKDLTCSFIDDFESFSGIDNYDTLADFDMQFTSDNAFPKGIIAVLLCKSLKNYAFKLSKYKVVEHLIDSFMTISLAKRSDYVMDCAVKLIDAGYPEAAEL